MLVGLLQQDALDFGPEVRIGLTIQAHHHGVPASRA